MTNHAPLPVAQAVIQTLGGVGITAAVCRVTHPTVCAWKRPRSKKGTGGLIPARYHAPILAYARAHDIPLTPADLIPEAGEVAA